MLIFIRASFRNVLFWSYYLTLFLIASVWLCLSIHVVYGSERVVEKKNAPPLFSWAGMYLGLNGGVGVPLHPNEHLHANGGRDIQTIDLYPGSQVRSGITFGVQAGYNWQKDH
ncbi:MAG: hypothetical protein ACR2HL_03340 [Methylocystis sp.]